MFQERVPLSQDQINSFSEEQLKDFVDMVINTLTENLDSDVIEILPKKQLAETLCREVIILRCILENLQTQFWRLEESVELFKDIKVEAGKIASTYTSLFKDLEEDTGLIEDLKASVRQVYIKFVKLAPSDTMMSMSELVFHDMLQNLADFNSGKDVEGTDDRCKALHDVLVVCSSFLQRITLENDDPEEMMQLRIQIMKMGQKVENLMLTCDMVPDWFFKMWLFDVTEEAKLIVEEISKSSWLYTLKTDTKAIIGTEKYKALASFGDEANQEAKTQELMLGFEEQESQLRRQLTLGPQHREIISIVGMPGLGKTTLALNVYKGCANSFHARAWCYVSQNFQKKELLQNIITQINEGPSTSQMNDEGLAKLLKQILLSKKNYLIVLDDIWDTNAWDALKQCFPTGSNRSRILVTSRYKTVALKLNGDQSSCLQLGLLDTSNSWRLLVNKVFGARSCPPKLCEVGQVIANRCGGLPLSIVVVAGALKNVEKSLHKWKDIARSLESHLVLNQDGAFNKIELSYNHLSVPMKKCFLYCGVFLKGKEIPRSKLVQLWCAERFALASDQQQSPELVAEKFLSDLADRSLLIVAKTGLNNRIRTCRVHDLLRDFAIQKAAEDKFFVATSRLAESWSLDRRLCLSCPMILIISKQTFPLPCAPRSPTRSLLIPTSSNGYDLDGISFIIGYFKSLIVLDLEKVEMGKDLPESVGELRFLRYLAVSGGIKSFPSSIGQLLNLETLFVKGMRGEVFVPDAIFRLWRLRHLHVNSRAQVDCLDAWLPNLQSFSTPCLSRRRNWKALFERLLSLRKLRCIFENESVDFSILVCLNNLESLKMFYYGLLPCHSKLSFPSNLNKLTLSKFRLPWSEAERIATLLPQLEILKLLLNAVKGSKWDTVCTFQRLKYFRLEGLDIEEWVGSDDNFPSLQRLVVRGCKRLKSIPTAFGRLDYLNCIEVHTCNPCVAKSAFKIKKMQIEQGNMQFETVTNPPEAQLSEDDEDSDE